MFYAAPSPGDDRVCRLDISLRAMSRRIAGRPSSAGRKRDESAGRDCWRPQTRTDAQPRWARRRRSRRRCRSGRTQPCRLRHRHRLGSAGRELAADSDVEYAMPDGRKHALSVPADPFYASRPYDSASAPASGGPLSGQWYLKPPAATGTAGSAVSSVNAEQAWEITTGAASVVVAVLDTGVRFEHPDFRRVSAGGNLLPDAEPDRRADEQRHRHGQRRPQRQGAAGARDRQVRRLGLRHRRRHALGRGPAGVRRAGQRQSRMRHQHEPGRRRRLHRRRGARGRLALPGLAEAERPPNRPRLNATRRAPRAASSASTRGTPGCRSAHSPPPSGAGG